MTDTIKTFRTIFEEMISKSVILRNAVEDDPTYTAVVSRCNDRINSCVNLLELPDDKLIDEIKHSDDWVCQSLRNVYAL